MALPFWKHFLNNQSEISHGLPLAKYLKIANGAVLRFTKEKMNNRLSVNIKQTSEIRPPYCYLSASLELAKHASEVLNALGQKNVHRNTGSYKP